MSNIKQICNELTQLSNQLKLEKAKQQYYKASLYRTGEHKIAVTLALLSSIFIGWQLARSRHLGRWVKRFLRYGFMTGLAAAKTKLIVMAKTR